MKVLIVSAYFPPGNAIGSVRVGKLAKHLKDNGCDVRVISALDDTLAQTLPVELEEGHVMATRWLDLHSLPRLIMGGGKAKGGGNANARGSRLMGVAYDLFRAFFHWPDRHVAWYFPARKAGRRLMEDWRPDVIYASAWPITSLMVGASLSREFSVPWIAELRDLWLDNHYYRVPVWRRWIDRILERKLLTSASLLVTVSEPLAEILKTKFAKPTAVVLNGFDPSDVVERQCASSRDVLTISYTGMIYPGRRDPRPLFEALQQMGPLAKRIRVRFFGRILPGVQALIDSYGLQGSVEACAPVPYQEALRIQAESDVLLLLMWDTPEERGVYTGKLFEYLGAKRPILSLGLERGVASDLIRDRQAGVVTNDPKCIAEALGRWLKQKDLLGEVPGLDKSVCAGLSRTEQFDRLLPDIRAIAETSVPKPKVFVVTRKLDVGGSERHLVQILPRLLEKFDVSVFVIHAGGKLERELVNAGVTVTSPPRGMGAVLGRIWVSALLMAALIRNRDAVAHFFLPEAYLLGGSCGTILGHPRMVMSRRSLNVYQAGHPVLAVVEKALHRRMKLVVGNSLAVVADLNKEQIPEQRTRLIYNGVAKPKCATLAERNAIRAQFGIGAEELLIIIVANLIPYKGHEDLITALGEVAPQIPGPWRLLVVGRDDGIGPSLQHLVEFLGLSERIVFAGQVVEIEGVWATADIGVLPSHQEGFSNSILEGMAAGLPMIVTNVGGNAEAVLHEKTGIVVSPHSPSELGKAILSLAMDPAKRRAFGEAARLRAETVFSVDACVGAYKALYESLYK